MIDGICSNVTRNIKEASMKSDTESEIIEYGLKIILFEIIASAVILFLSILLGVFNSVLITAAVFGTLRTVIGGAHSSSRLSCFLGYSIFIFATVLISMKIKISFPVITFLFMIAVIAIARYAPSDTFEKPLKNRKLRKKLKFISVIMILVLYVIVILVTSVDAAIANMITLAAVYAIFLLLPVSYKILGCRYGCERK